MLRLFTVVSRQRVVAWVCCWVAVRCAGAGLLGDARVSTVEQNAVSAAVMHSTLVWAE
ncbi:MAG TPA: hypothetical protein VIY28_16555 [Pseudonocardiaceae bacterium]